MISLGMDLGDHLVLPILHQLNLDVGSIELAQIGILLHRVVSYRFTVEDTGPADDHASAVEKVECVLRSEVHPFYAPETHGCDVLVLVQLQPLLATGSGKRVG